MVLFDPSQGPPGNFAATGAPTGDDDTDLGYEVGSMWVDTTNGNAYIAEDVTDGAAVWLEVVHDD